MSRMRIFNRDLKSAAVLIIPIPDDLQRHPRAPRWHLVASRTALGEGDNRLELITYRTESGERQMMAYLPHYRLLYSSDLFAPDEKDTWFTPEYLLELRDAAAREHLDVDGRDVLGRYGAQERQDHLGTVSSPSLLRSRLTKAPL